MVERNNVFDGPLFSVDRRILVAHPGDMVALYVKINGSNRLVVEVNVEGIPPSIGIISVSPRESMAPYTATVSITVNTGVEPGLYPFTLIAYNKTDDQQIGTETAGLLILPPEITSHNYLRLSRILYKWGAQGVIWYLIAKIYYNGARFSQLKQAYELIRGKRVKNGTIAKTLKRIVEKKLVYKDGDNNYHPLIAEEKIAFSRIDSSRVRIQRNTTSKTSKKELTGLEKLLHEPYIAQIAFKRARKIALNHGNLAAAYFLVYSIAGARMTGYLLLWFNAMFIYCERKTGFCHYFYSELLHRYFTMLGLREGIMYKQYKKYIEAIKVANKYINKYYGSHASSRRIHYQLKRMSYIEYDNEIYNIEIIHYKDGDIGVRLWNNKMQETLYEENITDKPIENKEIKPAYPYEHLYKPNEETYFHKPAGIY